MATLKFGDSSVEIKDKRKNKKNKKVIGAKLEIC